jgi:N-acetylglucosamine-6-phosphate deacetylase
MRLRARHYRSAQLIDITCEGDRITHVAQASGGREPTGSIDIEAAWIAPGLFDLQINGAMGRAFVTQELTTDQIAEVVSVCRQHGITGLCPTLITASREQFLAGFTALRRARDERPELARAMPCFHLEGPYISPDDGPRGAHPLAHVRPPDLDEFAAFQEAAGGRIRLVTLAPELPGALAFIEALTRQGVVVAIGHTAAPPATIRDAVKAGARLSTHLGNGSHAMLPRHDNYLWEQMAQDQLMASVIADGHHLPEAILRCIVRAKTPGRLVLTCDASSLAGMPPGRYTQWGQELEVLPGGKVVVPGTPFLAGSGVFLDACVRHLAGLGECELADVIDMASVAPRRLLGLEVPTLHPGQPADFILLDERLNVLPLPTP